MASSPSISASVTLVDSPRTDSSAHSSHYVKYRFSNVDDDEKKLAELREQRKRALDFQKHSQFGKAGRLYSEILHSCLQFFGDRSLRTLVAKEDFAVNLAQPGAYKQAQQLFETVLRHREMELTEKLETASHV